MRLTVKDAAGTGAVAIAGYLYAWHAAGTEAAVVGSVRWLAVALLALGVLACATGGDTLLSVDGYSRVMSWGGALATALTIAATVTGSERVLTALAVTIGLLWLVTTVRHALGIHLATPEVVVPDGSHERVPAPRH